MPTITSYKCRYHLESDVGRLSNHLVGVLLCLVGVAHLLESLGVDWDVARKNASSVGQDGKVAVRLGGECIVEPAESDYLCR